MSVSTSELVLRGPYGSLNSTVAKVVKFHTDASAYVGVGDWYVVVDSAKKLMIGKTLDGIMSLIDLSGTSMASAYSSDQLTFTDISVFHGESGSYSVAGLFVQGTDASQAANSANSTFLLAIGIGSQLDTVGSQETVYPNIAEVFPRQSSVDESNIEVLRGYEAFGYSGPSNPNEAVILGLKNGLAKFPFAEAGTQGVTSSALSDAMLADDIGGWLVESPQVQRSVSTYNGRVTAMGLPRARDTNPLAVAHLPDIFAVFSVSPPDNSIRYSKYMEVGIKSVPSGAGTALTLEMREIKPAQELMRMPVSPTTFWREALQSIATGADAWDYVMTFGGTKTLAVGWAIGAGVPDPTPPAGRFGYLSVVVAETGKLRLFGAVEAIMTFTTGGTNVVRAISCGYVGNAEDPFLFRSLATVPMHSKGVVFVADTSVMFTEACVTYSTGLTLPARHASSPKESVCVRFVGDATGMHISAGWWLATTYQTPTDTSHFTVYSSTDGQAWTLEHTQDLTALVSAYATTDLALSVTGVVSLGNVPHVASITGVMPVCVASFAVTHAGGMEYIVVSGAKMSNGDWLYRYHHVAQASAFTTFFLLPEGCCQTENAAPSLYLLDQRGLYLLQVPSDDQAMIVTTLTTPNTVLAGSLVSGTEAYTATMDTQVTEHGSTRYTGILTMVDAGTVKVLLTLESALGCMYGVLLTPDVLEYAPVTFVEEIRAGHSTYNDRYPMADYSVAHTVTSPEHGTLAFLRGPSKQIEHLWVSDDAIAATYDYPVGRASLTGIPDRAWYRIIGLGLCITSVYADVGDASGTPVTDIYMTDTNGSIWKFARDSLAITKVSTAMAGNANLRLLKVGTVWYALSLPSWRMYSSGDLQTWTQVAEGTEVSGDAFTAEIPEVLPMAAGGVRALPIPDSTSANSIVLNW